MNLVTGNWIPVLDSRGRTERVGLERLFSEAESIRDLAVNPPQRIALMRFLICLVQAALDGPENQADWQACKNSIPRKVECYLQDHFDLFELYGKKPFMQVPTLKHTYNAVVDKLDFGLAAGGACSLYDHESNEKGRKHDDGWIALMLITYQSFCPGGTIGITKWNDISTQPGKNKGPGTSADAVCVEQSALHTFVRDDNLMGTMFYNLLTKDLISDMPNTSWGKPTWEINLSAPDNPEIKQNTITYLGRLSPLTRSILLCSNMEKFTLANGVAYPKFPEYRETTMAVAERGQGKLSYVSVSLERHPWREINSLLSFSPKANSALVFRKFTDKTNDRKIDIWTGGMSVKSGQYKIFDVGEWSFNVPFNMIGNEGPISIYSDGIQKAEQASLNLKFSLIEYAKNLLDGDKANKPRASKTANEFAGKLNKKAQTSFWSILDQTYGTLFEAANDLAISLETHWQPTVQEAAYAAFDQVCTRVTPRQILAFAKARHKLKIRRKMT